MNKNQNGRLFHINSPERYANPLANEIDNKEGYWNTPELECAMGMDDLTNVNGNGLKRSLPQLDSEFFEKETDLYTDKNVTECELPELMLCYKESVVKDICVDEGIHSEKKILIENREDVHEALDYPLPKNEDKSEIQENFNSALLNHGDISSSLAKSDDSYLAGKKGDLIEPLIQDGLELEYGDGEKGKGYNGPILDDHEDDQSDTIEKSTDTKSLLVDGPLSLIVNDCNGTDCGPSDLVQSLQTVEDIIPAIEKITCDASAVESGSDSLSSEKLYLPQTSLKFLLNSSEFGTNDDDEQQSHQIPMADISKSPDSSSDAEEVSSSGQPSNPTVNSEVETGSVGIILDTEKAAAISDEENSIDDHDLPVENGNLENLIKASQEQYGVGESSFSVVGPIEDHEDGISDTALRLVQRDEGESSFFMGGGPVSGRIAYSGQIPFSGSISLRSESSTTSTRSFAFPVLQNEWNSSPVRMAKAERRRFHKHRGWKQGILCCRF